MSLVPPGSSPLVPGYRLDRYELLCPIAEGGMAQVWVARLRGKHGFEKLVAIKTILPKYASDPQFQRMFLDEARIASGIAHANVAQILDLGDEHGVLYLAMEWVDGDALTKLRRALDKAEEPFPMGVLLRIVADACGGLHAAHELRGKDGAPLGVVHRDVSPQNILISSRGVTKLIDFGIAKARDRTAADTNSGVLKGKVHYMAPEQAIGLPVDPRADIWAIGAILYHYLSGRPPFDGANHVATLHLLMQGKPPEPLPSTVPAAVRAIVERALSHSRELRYATAAEIQAAIETAMASSNLVTTTADVAAFTEKHLVQRAARRREAIDIALAAAEDRERVRAILKPETDDSHSGVSAGRIPSPASVPTAASLGLDSPVVPSRSRTVLVAAVGAVGVVVGIAATVALRSGGGVHSTESAGVVGSGAPVMPPAASPSSPSPSPLASDVASSSASPSTSASATIPAASPARPVSSTRAPPGPPRSTAPTKIPKVIANGF